MQTRPESKLKRLYTLQAAPKLHSLAVAVSNSSAEREPADQPRAAEKQDILTVSFSISMFYTTCWEKVIMFKSLTQVGIIIKTAEM